MLAKRKDSIRKARKASGTTLSRAMHEKGTHWLNRTEGSLRSPKNTIPAEYSKNPYTTIKVEVKESLSPGRQVTSLKTPKKL